MGGSQGANAINQFIAENLIELTQKYQILHVTGKGKKLNISKTTDYLGFEYVDQELADLYAAADYILCRAGASTLTELRALNKKTILVPLPSKQSRGDQLVNAEIFAKENSAVVLLEEELSFESLEREIKLLMKINLDLRLRKNKITKYFQEYLIS